MKRTVLNNRTLLNVFLPLLLLVSLALPGYAATKWFDNNGATAGAGVTTGNILWSTTSSKWASESAGTTASVAWAAGDAAVFCAGTDATGTYTASVSSTTSAASLTVEEGTCFLKGAVLTCNAITVNSGTKLSYGSSGELVNTGSGTLTLNGGTFEY